ncbi:hypothetical protein DBR47_15335 [Paucibacter sp. KBW04]|uniref:hypothetical protein n=1 Tax=Paucibacter sp. KBW04 TaxID=2153361 RepID=UPI000F5689CA|nr:hypothetical protein [Paucibacter sp. KBW04]RQO57206.1 hypothetical protein DBR47_15335 [Paucibacter sp. KBW04]
MAELSPSLSPSLSLKMLKTLWAAPCSALGLLAALPLLLFAGAQLRRIEGRLEVALFQGETPRHSVWARMPFSALTLGHVILGCSEAELARLRRHEQAHVRQYERWGVLFLLAYPAASLLAALRGGHFYRDNCFEVQARLEEEWPRDSG